MTPRSSEPNRSLTRDLPDDLKEFLRTENTNTVTEHHNDAQAKSSGVSWFQWHKPRQVKPQGLEANSKLEGNSKDDKSQEVFREKVKAKLEGLTPTTYHTQTSNEAVIANKTLFPDGRYSYLWKTYQPTELTEGNFASTYSSELSGLGRSVRDQENLLKEAARENCAIDLEKYWNCLSNGSATERLLLCRNSSAKYFSCIDMQSKLLRALGYLALPLTQVDDAQNVSSLASSSPNNTMANHIQNRATATREAIQVHADRLYRKYEKEEEEVVNQINNGDGTHISNPTSFVLTREDVDAISRKVLSSVPDTSKKVKGLTELKSLPSLEELFKIYPQLEERYTKSVKDASEDTLLHRELEFEAVRLAHVANLASSIFARERESRAERTASGTPSMRDVILNWSGFNRRSED